MNKNLVTAIILIAIAFMWVKFSKNNHQYTEIKESTTQSDSNSLVNNDINYKHTSPPAKPTIIHAPKVIPSNSFHSQTLIEEERQCRLRWHDPQEVEFAKNELQAIQMEMRTEKIRLTNYVTMNLMTPKGREALHQNIITYVKTAYYYYRRLFSLSASESFTINLAVLPDEQTYHDYLLKFGVTNPDISQGIYFGANNTALVKYNNDNQALRTAIHETVHVFNYRIIGLLPRWINEGTAETLEFVVDMDLKKHIQNINPTGSPTDLYDFDTLIRLEDSWESSNRVTLYQSANTLVSYFISTKERLAALKKMLAKEQAEVCVKLEPDDIADILHENNPYFYSNYADWMLKYLLK